MGHHHKQHRLVIVFLALVVGLLCNDFGQTKLVLKFLAVFRAVYKN